MKKKFQTTFIEDFNALENDEVIMTDSLKGEFVEFEKFDTIDNVLTKYTEHNSQDIKNKILFKTSSEDQIYGPSILDFEVKDADNLTVSVLFDNPNIYDEILAAWFSTGIQTIIHILAFNGVKFHRNYTFRITGFKSNAIFEKNQMVLKLARVC